MKKMSLESILQGQLDAANKVIHQLTLQVEELTELIKSLRVEISQKDIRVSELLETLSSLELAITGKEREVIKQQNISRGLSKLVFNNTEKQSSIERKTEEKKKADIKARKNNNAKRNMHCDMEEVVQDIYPESKEYNWALMKDFACHDSIRYEYIPPRFIKHILRQHVYKVNGEFYQGKLPLAPLHNSSFDGSFIAGIMQLRYMYSMSVERITSLFNDHGFDVTKSTLNGLLSKTAGLMENIYSCMRNVVLTDKELGCDETYMKVQVQVKTKSGKYIKKGYIWVVIAKTLGLVYYFYEDGSRSEDVILNLLKNYSGTIQSDAFAPYRKLGGASYPEIIRLACLQHVKRKFIDLKGMPDADKMVNLINSLYHCDHQHRIGIDGWTEADNLKYRKQYAPPILKEIKKELKRISSRKDLLPDSELSKAVVYMQNEMSDIENIFKGGRNSLDNNLVERYNRYISLSRKNSLFFGSHKGARNGAIFYSLACSCRMQGINFFEYITDVLNQNSKIPPTSRPEAYRHLLPDVWHKSNK